MIVAKDRGISFQLDANARWMPFTPRSGAAVEALYDCSVAIAGTANAGDYLEYLAAHGQSGLHRLWNSDTSGSSPMGDKRQVDNTP